MLGKNIGRGSIHGLREASLNKNAGVGIDSLRMPARRKGTPFDDFCYALGMLRGRRIALIILCYAIYVIIMVYGIQTKRTGRRFTIIHSAEEGPMVGNVKRRHDDLAGMPITEESADHGVPIARQPRLHQLLVPYRLESMDVIGVIL